MIWRCFPAMLLFFLVSTGASAITPELVAGFDFTCLLASPPDASARSAVRCWSLDDGKTLKIPALREPTHLAAVEHTVCAVDLGKVTCWDFAPFDGLAGKIAAGLSALKKVTAIAGANHDFCVADGNAGLKCFGVSYDTPNYKEPLISTTAPVLKDVERITLTSRMGCAITRDHQPHCWAAPGEGWYGYGTDCPKLLLQRQPKFTSVSAITLPNDSFWSNCRACAIEGKTVKCWGENIDINPVADRSFEWQQEFSSPTQVFHAQFGTVLAVLDGRRATLVGRPYEEDRYAFDLPGGIVLGATQADPRQELTAQTLCTANEQSIRCSYHPEPGDRLQTHDYQIDHGLFFRDIVSVADTFEAIARGEYREKAAIFRETARLLRGSGDDLREPFTVLALQALADNGSEYEATVVRPFFDVTLRAYPGYTRLEQMPARSELQNLGLKLLGAILQTIPSGQTSGADAALGDLKTQVGLATVETGGPAARREMLRVFNKHRSELAELSRNARLAWLAPTLERLFSYLAN